MNTSETKLPNVFQSLRNKQLDVLAVKLLLDHIDDKNFFAEVISLFLKELSSESKSPEEAVDVCNNALESIADQSLPIACKLMRSLYSHAGSLFMHDVCDSIKLWEAEVESTKQPR